MVEREHALVIHSVRLTDFGPFCGTHALDFIPDGVNVIHGKNGFGKSTIFKALRFALFGNLFGDVSKRHINRLALRDGIKECSVDISFSLLGRRYNLKRTLTFNGKVKTHTKDLNLHDLYIHLPPDTAGYFMFDSETVRNWVAFFRPEPLDNAPLLGLGPLKRVLQDLEAAISHLKRDIAQAYNDERYTALKNRFDHLETEIKDIRTNLRAKKSQLRRLKAIYKDLKTLKGLKSELNALEAGIETKKKTLRDMVQERSILVSRIRSDLPHTAYAIIADELNHSIKTVIDTKSLVVDARLMEGRYSAQEELLGSIETNERCICGTPLSSSNYGRKSIRSLRKEVSEKRLSLAKVSQADFWSYDILLEAKGAMMYSKRVSSTLSAHVDKLRKVISTIKATEAEINALEIRLKECISKIKSMKELETVLGLDIKTASWADIIATYNGKKGSAEGSILTLEDMLRVKMEERAKALSEMETVEEGIERSVHGTRRALNKAEALKKALISALTSRVNLILSGIEKEANEFLLESTNKPEEIKALRVTGGMAGIELKNREYMPLTDLSDGERHLIALSIMAALQQFSASNVLIIDGPFGRLDGHHREALLRALPRMAPQVIVFTTDSLRSNLGKEDGASWRSVEVYRKNGVSRFEVEA